MINQHQKVLESCFVGVPDEKWGEKVVAAVVTTPAESVTVQEIKDHCRQQLLAWKCPKEVFFLKELPRNKMGKVMKEIVTKFFFSLSVPPSAKA